MIQQHIHSSALVKWYWLAPAFIVGLFFSDPLLWVIIICSVVLMIKLLWKSGEPPILLLGLSFQWLQLSVGLICIWFAGEGFDAAIIRGQSNEAVYFGVLGLLSLAIGFKWTERLMAVPKHNYEDFIYLLAKTSPVKVFCCFFGFSILAIVGGKIAWLIPSLTQPILAFFSIKWVFLFLLVIRFFLIRDGGFLAAIGVLWEFVNGFGFLSTFQYPIIVSIAAYLTITKVQIFRRVGGSILAIIAILIMGSVWQSIKSDYRYNYVHDDMSAIDKAAAVSGLLGNWVDNGTLDSAFDEFVARLSTTFFFNKTIERVPSVYPHEYGAHTATALLHLIPRLFFPDKAVLNNDSEMVRHYTGVWVAGVEQGTTVGLGYMVEWYIDFGAFGLLMAMFIYGMFLSWSMAKILKRSGTLLAPALMVAYFLPFHMTETSLAKLLGGQVTHFLILLLFTSFFAAKIQNWLVR